MESQGRGRGWRMAKHGRQRDRSNRSTETAAHADGSATAERESRLAAPARSGSLEDEIRLRAYYRFLEREGEPGDEISDWLEAESDVLGRHATGVDADEKAGERGR
jgi:hypothetical protein